LLAYDFSWSLLPRGAASFFWWISQYFDHVINTKHKAEDVVNANSNNTGGVNPPYGTKVFAAESGTVVAVGTGHPPAAQGFPACQGQGAIPNYVKIKGSDGHFTVYVHITPSVTVGASVTQGQQIGVTDNSGCQSHPHLHMARKDPSNNPVNFTIPCPNKLPTSTFADGLADDDVPSNL
jgi:murein DD-endopeptidase MepM/ murein hydrolase activator NlpD